MHNTRCTADLTNAVTIPLDGASVQIRGSRAITFGGGGTPLNYLTGYILAG